MISISVVTASRLRGKLNNLIWQNLGEALILDIITFFGVENKNEVSFNCFGSDWTVHGDDLQVKIQYSVDKDGYYSTRSPETSLKKENLQKIVLGTLRQKFSDIIHGASVKIHTCPQEHVTFSRTDIFLHGFVSIENAPERVELLLMFGNHDYPRHDKGIKVNDNWYHFFDSCCVYRRPLSETPIAWHSLDLGPKLSRTN